MHSRCVGEIDTLSSTCSDADSKLATIQNVGPRTLFRFVPLEGSDDTYRIILKDRKGGCNRFLSAASDCSVTDVGFAKNDYREGLQRWVITKVSDPGTPTPSPSPTNAPTPSPSPTQSPVPAPTITAAYGTSFSSGNVTVASPDASVNTCTVTLTPGGRSVTIEITTFPGMATASFTQLAAATTYSATASCRLADGSFTPSSDPVAFSTFGGNYNRPPPGVDTQCDGRGETVNEDGQCVCDAYNIVDGPFKANGEGGCECFDSAIDLGYGPCLCPQGSVNCYEGCCTTCSPSNFSLTASNGLSAGEDFGRVVALNAAGDVMVVGDYAADYNELSDTGSAYVFRFDGSEWMEEEILWAGAEASDYTVFGASIAINSAGDLIAIGDYDGNATLLGDHSGKVYLFEKTGSGWGVVDILTPSLSGPGGVDQFGQSVAVNAHGNVSVVGDPNANYLDNISAGRAYVFVYDGSVWNLTQILDAGVDVRTGNDFGKSVAINSLGDVIAVGDPTADANKTNIDKQGRAYIFRFDGTSSWVLSEEVEASDGDYLGADFGDSLALDDSGDVLVVGDKNADLGYLYPGSAYVFRYVGSQWIEETKFIPGPDAPPDYDFGYSVDISGNGEVVAVGDPEGTPGRYGGVYIYRYDGSSWNLDTNFTVETPTGDYDDFGTDVALNQDGTVLVVGDRNANADANAEDGLTYIYRYNGSDWLLEQTLSPGAEAEEFGDFGCSVDINAAGDMIAIGDFDARADSFGKVFIFRYSGGIWSFSESFNGSDTGTFGDEFGNSVALDSSGDVLVVGDKDADELSENSYGKAYVFRYDTSSFNEEAILTPPYNTLVAQDFGWSVSMNGDGDVVLVGDPGSPYLSTDSDNYLKDAGVAYVFMKSGTTWIEHLLFAGEYAHEGAEFGISTALNAAGDVAVVGALDTNQTVYVFRYDGSSWSLTDNLSASDGMSSSSFGGSVALNAAGTVLVVGDRDAKRGSNYPGQVYVFRYNGADWVEEQILTSDTVGYDDDEFGCSVAINAAGDVIVVGDYESVIDYGEPESYSPGKVFMFVHDGSAWSQDRVFVGSNSNDFGKSVAMDATGDVVAVGDANGHIIPSDYDELGRAYVFGVCRYANDAA